MTETTTLRNLLLPELEQEFASTRKMIDHLPDGHNEYKPHEKSFSLARLAGHMAELPSFIAMILTTPGYEIGSGVRDVLLLDTRPQLLAEFNERADKAITALKNTSDETLAQDWKLSFKTHTIFNGSRYNAYRNMGVNHLIHHRAQVGVYLRLLNHKVPGTYGPTADEPFGG